MLRFGPYNHFEMDPRIIGSSEHTWDHVFTTKKVNFFLQQFFCLTSKTCGNELKLLELIWAWQWFPAKTAYTK